MKKAVLKRKSERGGAGVKFLFVLTILFLTIHAGYNFIPIAYSGESLKQDMQTAVIQGTAVPGRKTPIDSVKARIYSAAVTNNIPTDAFITVKQTNNLIEAHIAYTKNISILPFGIYDYQYQFDHTERQTGFLTKQ